MVYFDGPDDLQAREPDWRLSSLPQRSEEYMVASERGAAVDAARRVIERVFDVAGDAMAETADLAIDIARIPAPTGDESARAARVAQIFREHGLNDVHTDDLHDVVARVQGASRGKPVLLAAHTDTVFPRETELTIQRNGKRISGPGIGDNSLGVAAVLMLPVILQRAGITPTVDLLLTGNVGEEGNGNLRGIRRVMDDYPDIGAAIAVEGHNLGRVTHAAVGSRRLRVTVSGPGGHSWGDFGRPNAIHAAGEIINDLAHIPVTQTPKTSLSVGTISGGISVNSIPPSCTFDLDSRSVSATALTRLSERIDRVLEQPRPGVTVDVEVIGDRPAGVVPVDSAIVQHAIALLTALGLPAIADASSTDANIAISRGIPAVCIGLTSGGNVHREDEFINLQPLPDGLRQLTALAIITAKNLSGRTL